MRHDGFETWTILVYYHQLFIEDGIWGQFQFPQFREAIQERRLMSCTAMETVQNRKDEANSVKFQF